jgi:hypothetical protein
MIACIVILLILLTISPILWWIYEVIKYEYKRKFQFLMFNQIEKGDYVWKLVGANITPIKVESVSYGFDKNNNITKIRLYFDSRWDSITILLDSARTFKIENGDGEYYTIFEHAEAKRLFTEIKRIKSRNDLLINTDEDIKIAIHEELKNIEELKKQVKEFKKKMS